MKYIFKMLENEYWWGGSSSDGSKEPFGADSEHYADYNADAQNQTMPLYVSSKGRYIWSDSAFKVSIKNGEFTIDGDKVELVEAGKNLRDAYLAAMKAHFPFSDKKLPELFFRTAQYNTWMQFTYDPTQEGVLQYARDIISHGFKPGVLIIDEGWHGRYGIWEFDRLKFPDPKAMVDELHKMGFVVMLWLVPYVCPDGLDFIKTIRWDYNPQTFDKHYLRNADGKYALVEWWNGFSFILDMTNPYDVELLDGKLHHLMEEYGVDGFKFDGGNLHSYAEGHLVNKPAQTAHTAAELNIAWNEFGEKYEYHEYKDTFKGGGKAVIQRLSDRNHEWHGNGIDSIIPAALINGVIGHPYICPDMIGGGEWTYRALHRDKFDPELFVRMAQVSALFPMMQFSWAPWEDLDEEHLGYVRDAAKLHADMADEIVSMLENTRLTGEPTLRNLEYNYPHCGFERVTDQFMLGSDILVAPVIEKGQTEREVVFPDGKWQLQNDQTVYSGGVHTVKAPLSVLPWFRKVQ